MDDRDKYDEVQFGFIDHSANGPGSGHVETLPVEEKPKGKVIPSIEPSDEFRLFSDLFAEYGHPTLVKLKVLFAFLSLGAGVGGALLVTSPIVACGFLALAALPGAAYILSSN